MVGMQIVDFSSRIETQLPLVISMSLMKRNSNLKSEI